MKKAVITLVFIISLCMPYATFAQDLDKNWEIGVGGGFYVGSEAEDGFLRVRDDRVESFERLLGKYEVTLDNEPIFYLNGGFRFKDYGFFRLQVGYSEYQLDVERDIYSRDIYNLPDADLTCKLQVIPISANFNYFLMRKTPFKPYISLGFTSYVFVGSEDFSVAPTARLGADCGAGLEYYFTDMLAVNFDAGYHFLKIELQADDPYTERGYPQTYEEINAVPNRFEVAVGIKFLVY